MAGKVLQRAAENERERVPAALMNRHGWRSKRAETFYQRRWNVGGVALLAVTISIAFVGTPRPSAPLLLWNESPSMETGIYLRTELPPATGSIVSVEIPDTALRYAAQRSIAISWDSFLKPIAAAGGDHVCVSIDKGLVINGKKLAEVRRTDSDRNIITAWTYCRRLKGSEYFLYAPRVPESYDSRYYGPVERDSIKGVYEPLWTW